MSHESDEQAAWKKATAEWVGAWERGMAAWWDKVLDSPEVLSAMNRTLAGQVEARRNLQRTGQRWMERMNLPTRADLSRITRIATLLEERLLSLEDTLLDLGDRLAATEKEAIRARVEAAETRIELMEKLATLEARLEAQQTEGDR